MNLARDQALLQQRILETQHELASSLRNLESLYAQYEANRKVREASEINLDRQFRLFRIGGLPGERITAVEVLVAVTDWGNSVSAEALSLTLYNSQTATLAPTPALFSKNMALCSTKSNIRRSDSGVTDMDRGVTHSKRRLVRMPIGTMSVTSQLKRASICSHSCPISRRHPPQALTETESSPPHPGSYRGNWSR